MKAFRILSMLLAVAVFMSCSGNGNEEIPEPIKPNEKPETIVVSLNLGGEYVKTSESPLTRTDTPKKYYGVNVYCMEDNENSNSYDNYAYGVFDNIEDMKITLLGGYKYKFECTSVEEADDELRFIEPECLGMPFLYGSEKHYFSLENLNIFTISKSDNLRYIQTGETYIKNAYKTFPRTNRYYGELENYVPTEAGTATISMKRTDFGLKMTVNSIPDGTLKWSIYSDDDLFKYLSTNRSSHTGSDVLEFSSTYTFSDVYESWKDENYSFDFKISFTWTRANEYIQNFSKTVTVKRNVMTNVNVKLIGGSSDISLGLTEENVEMTNEDVNVVFDGGSLSDTNINSEE